MCEVFIMNKNFGGRLAGSGVLYPLLSDQNGVKQNKSATMCGRKWSKL